MRREDLNFIFKNHLKFPVLKADSNIVSHVDRSFYSPPQDQTGFDRLKLMYTTDAYGNLSPELSMTIHTTMGGFVIGGLIGILSGGQMAAHQYMERQQATTFRNQYDARRALQDRMTIGMGKGFVKYGWRTSLFTAMYMTSVSSISVYRGKAGILEHVLAGGIAGFSYKFLQGPRASLVGCVVGSVLGLVAGGLTVILMRVTGVTVDDIRHWHYQVRAAQYGRPTGTRDVLGDDISTGTTDVDNDETLR